MSSFHSRAVFSLLLACLWGCEPSRPPGMSMGTIQLAITLSEDLAPGDVTRVTVTVSAADMSTLSTDLVSSEGVWGGVLGELPAGAHRTLLAQAFDASNALRYQGRAEDVTVTAGPPGRVSLTLQNLAASPPFTNSAPILNSLRVNPISVSVGGVVSLLASARDTNPGDSVSYAWSAPSGGFADPTQPGTTWTAPMDPGPVPLKLQVSDSRGAAFTVDVTVQVLEGPSSAAEIHMP